MKTNMIHRVPHLFDDCAEMLNKEWPRSKTARLHSLQKSRDDFPVSLVMIDTIDNKEVLIGHSKLSLVHGESGALLIESVIVQSDLRGKGYGRSVMEESEKFALENGYDAIYLTTHDKQGFYERIGYSFCDPVLCLGGNASLIPDHLLDAMKVNVNKSKVGKDPEPNKEERTLTPCQLNTAHPPPPPPPVPQLPRKDDQHVKWDPRSVSWMKKKLELSQLS